LLGWLLWPFISVIVLAIVITGVFNPVYRAFHRKLNATLSSLITCVIIFFVLFVPVSAFVGILANEAYDLYLTARDAVVSNPINELLENTTASAWFPSLSDYLLCRMIRMKNSFRSLKTWPVPY
jgi:predicted PurR-regulated permease PerM